MLDDVISIATSIRTQRMRHFPPNNRNRDSTGWRCVIDDGLMRLG